MLKQLSTSVSADFKLVTSRLGNDRTTDFLNENRRRQFLRGSGNMLPLGSFWILTPWSLFLGGVSESFSQDFGQFHSPRMNPCKSTDFFVKVNFLVVV